LPHELLFQIFGWWTAWSWHTEALAAKHRAKK
jgi:hypothetical protein